MRILSCTDDRVLYRKCISGSHNRKITKFTINQQKFDSELHEAIRAECQQNFRVIELDEGKRLRIQLETILFRSQETEFKSVNLSCSVQDKIAWIEVIHQSRCSTFCYYLHYFP